MSHCSCSQISSSSHRSQSNDSYRQWSSSSITTVSSQSDNEQQNRTTDKEEEEEWPAPPPPEEEIEPKPNTAEIWRFEKSIDLKRQQPTDDGCIFKATMINGHVVIRDPSAKYTIIPGKHFSMKVVFNV